MILITGGAGYIGAQTNKMLSSAGFDTVVADNLSRGHREFARWGSFELCDMRDPAALERVFSKYKISAVMHFAALTYVRESVEQPQLYRENNFVGTSNLLAAMCRFGVKHIIFSSTCATYGNPVSVPMTEEHSQKPVNPYGETKLLSENAMRDLAAEGKIKHVFLRYFNAAGADPSAETGEWHSPETHIIPLALSAAREGGKPLEIFGTDYPTPDGTCIRDYVHVCDIAQAHLLALDYLRKGGESSAFNLGNGKGFSVREVITAAEKVSGRKVKFFEGARRVGDPAVLLGSSAKAEKTLGWKPVFPALDQIVETAHRWHSTEPHTIP